jgi:hypothetical protein
MTKSYKIDIIVTIILIGFCIAAYFHLIIAGSYLGSGYNGTFFYLPNTFLYLPSDKFMDFFNPMELVQDFDPYINNDNLTTNTISSPSYPPFTYIIFYFFSLFTNKNIALGIFLEIFVISTFYIVVFFAWDKSLSKVWNIRNIFALSFLTYPFLFLIDRGNIEGIIFVFEAIFLILYLRKKFNLSLIFLAMATAMKLYPGLLALLFLKDKRYKEFLSCSFLTLAISVISLLLFKGGIVEKLHSQIDALRQYGEIHVLQPHPDINGLSIIFSLKILIKLFQLKIDTGSSYFIYNVTGFCIAIYGGIFYYILRFENVVWKQLTILISAGIILFNCSYDYKMISLLLPLLTYIEDRSKSRYDMIYSICFGLLLIPKKIFIHAIFAGLSISNITNQALMIIIIWFIIRERFVVLNPDPSPVSPPAGSQ